jgi:hypothetical protein
MTTNAHNGYELFSWRSTETPEQNSKRLIEMIAPKVLDTLCNADGALCYLRDRTPVPVRQREMHEIVSRHIRTPVLANIGNAHEPKFEFRFEPLSFAPPESKFDLAKRPTNKTLLEIIDALVPMVAKAPMPPREIRPQHMEQIIERLRAGEPAREIAKSFNIPDLDQVRDIGKAHGIMVH